VRYISAAGAVLVILFNILRIAHLYAGASASQIPGNLMGKVVFGSDFSYDNGVYRLINPKSRFDGHDSSIAWVAYFSQPANAATVTRAFESIPPTESIIWNQPISLENTSADTVTGVWNADQLKTMDLLNRPGTYRITYLRNSTVLATGEFDVGNVVHHGGSIVLPTSTPQAGSLTAGPGQVVAGTAIDYSSIGRVVNGGKELIASGPIVWVAEFEHFTAGNSHVIAHITRDYNGRVYRSLMDTGLRTPGLGFIIYDPATALTTADVHRPGRYSVVYTQGKTELASGSFTVTL
jgi:hypothetical protein